MPKSAAWRFFRSDRPAWGGFDAPHGAKGGRMSDTESPITDQTQTEDEQPNGAPVDWKEMARKWEKLAKQNKGAADELAALKASQMTEQEKLEQRAKDAEALVAQYRADEQRREDAAQVATATGVPLSLLLHCASREDMEQFAADFERETHITSAPPAPKTRIIRSGDGSKEATRDLFEDFMTKNFNNRG